MLLLRSQVSAGWHGAGRVGVRFCSGKRPRAVRRLGEAAPHGFGMGRLLAAALSSKVNSSLTQLPV